jgi:hypothetical protein
VIALSLFKEEKPCLEVLKNVLLKKMKGVFVD